MFNVGDEICVVDDSPYLCGSAFDLKKGDVFTVLAVFPEGTVYQDMKLACAGISIGVQQEFIFRCPGKLDEHRLLDLWDVDRFRKIERKFSREELYSLIGIDGMVDQREGVSA